jgi:ribosomal protein L34E
MDAAPSLCCQTCAKRYIKKHRDVAVCDTCGMLLLGYGNDRDYEETRKALAEQGIPCATFTQGALRVIVKPRMAKPKGR